MDGSTRPDLRREAAGSALATLRTRLLDMSGRNPLISFPHARQSRSRACVRAVDGHLNILHEHLREGRPLPLLGLPAQEDEPGDERTDQFRAALETARSTDEEHQAALAGLAEDEFASRKAAGIERQLRDRVRETLGLPTWQAVTLKGLTEHATSLGIDPSFELWPTPPETGGDAQGTHVRLQALMLADPLERTLAKIRDTARTAAEESGLNTLHVAFGFLEWFESDGSDRLITSPLLLMQVDIDRRIVRSRYQYQLTGAGDETQVNLTLSERLDRDFRIKLPALGAEEAPEAYLARVLEEVCKGRRRWAVRRWMTLAHFPFARLAMFNDLDEALWEGPGGLAGHKLVGALLGGSESGQAWFAEEHDVDAPEVARAVPLLALDADASQYSAIIDVMAGQNLVIEGPPGTGKSQTITNLVAAALARGKRVLFMADKQAALQVVKDRIDAIGLGDFCLELHSGKARKRDVLDSLRRRLERRPGRSALDHLDERMRALTATRRDLTRYTNVLNSGLGSFGATVHDVLWADRRRRNEAVDAGRPLDALAVPDCEAITRSEIELRKSALDRLVRAAEPIVSRFGNPGAHPWRGMARSDLPAVDHEQVVREAEDVAAMLDTVADCASALRALGIDAAATIGGIQAVAAAISHLPVAPDVPSRFYRGLGSMAVRAAAQDWLRACEDYHSALAIVRDTGMAAAKTVGAAVAEALELIWAGLAASAPAGLTIAGLPGWLAGVHAEATRLQELARVAAQAASLFGLGAPGPSEDLAVVLRGSELARDAGETVIGFICPEFVARDNASVIARAAVEIAGLRTTAEALAANYSVAPATSPNVLRKHVAALREAGAFGFFSSSVKAAARAHAELQRRPGKLGRIATARALGEIAEHLEGVAALEERHDVRAAFGACYRGLATDVEAAVAVSGWATRVRDELAGFDDVTLNVRRTLTGGDAERLQAIAALDGGALRELADYVARQPGRSASIADTAAAVAARAAAIRALADACERHGLPAATLVSDMPELCQALRVATTAANKAQMPEQLSAALGRCGPAPLDDHASLRAALALAAEVAALPLDDAAKRMLHGAEPIALGSAFVPAARAVVEAVERGLAGWKRLKDTLALDEACFMGARILHLSPADAAGRLREAATHPSGLGEWTAFLIERRQAEGLGLGDLLSLWDAGATLGPLPAAFERCCITPSPAWPSPATRNSTG